MEKKNIKIYDSDLTMEEFKKLMCITIDENKTSQYFKELWNDVETYKEKIKELEKKDNKK